MAYVSQDMKKSLAPTIKAVLKKYGMKGTIAVDNHSTLVVNISEGPIDFGHRVLTDDGLVDRGYVQVNHYWIDKNYVGDARDFLNELADAMRGPDFYDHSDSMTDYFCLSHYIAINVGRFSKPYKLSA